MSIQNILFVDIETVPEQKTAYDLDNEKLLIYEHRFRKSIDQFAATSREHHLYWTDGHYEGNAALYAEFGKIVCISIGNFKNDKFYVKNFCGTIEQILLDGFTEACKKFAILCAHNGKEFDFPYLFRRYLINGLTVPTILNTIGRKPWEVCLEDTMEMWGSTQWRYRVGIDLLAHIFRIPSPKTEMSGADVSKIYYDIFEDFTEEKQAENLKKIGDYCNGDVVTLAKVYCKIKGLPGITDEQIVYL